MPDFEQLGPLEEVLAPGVAGYTMEHGGALYVPLIRAMRPGSGDVGRYLDSLPKDRTVKVPTVLSLQLAGMLIRRGFKLQSEWSADFGEWVEVYQRDAGVARAAP